MDFDRCVDGPMKRPPPLAYRTIPPPEKFACAPLLTMLKHKTVNESALLGS